MFLINVKLNDVNKLVILIRDLQNDYYFDYNEPT